MPFLVYKISGFNVPKITCSALFRRFFWVKLNGSPTNYNRLNGVSTIMKFLRISFVICLFLSLNVSAVDNSFKLDFDGDGRTDIALYREGSRSAQLAPQPSYWYFLNTQTGQARAVHWGRTFDVPAPADYDNDGKTDVAIYRWWDFDTGDTNEWWISKSTGGHQILVYEPGYNKYSRNYFGDGGAETGQIYLVDINQEPK